MNNMEKMISDIWKDVLKNDNIELDDNFFDVGGTSLKALEIVEKCKKSGIIIPIYKMFTCQTIREISAVAEFSENQYRDVDLLMNVIKKIDGFEPDENYIKMLDEYRKKYENISYKVLPEPKNILVTGATGYIACHIIQKILTESSSHIYAIVRGKDEKSAAERFWNLTDFYFPDSSYREIYADRITFLTGDLTKDYFGLPESKYSELSEIIDTVLHTAANINHYGKWEEFEKLNINGTKRVIEFMKTGCEKTLNHVSTISTCHTYKRSEKPIPFTEYDTLLDEDAENYYVRSKLISENLVVSERGNFRFKIFRPSNIIQSFKYGKYPYGTTKDNLYVVNTELSILNLLEKDGLFPDLNKKLLDFSYVDETAEAIYRLMGIEENDCFIYHVYNPNMMTISEYADLIGKEKIPLDKIRDVFTEKFDSISYDLKQLCTLSIAEGNVNQALIMSPENSRTVELLKKLGFEWDSLGEKNISDIINFQ
ncbi:MAG: SDR family oxidoreductase [Ruminococcus sp.]|nr:SDR family oxidoreductase [Ruminococcus sp.]